MTVADFTAKDVKALRDRTGAGMMDAKRALQENGGDPEKAATWLREKGLSQAAKRSDRESSQGAVAVANEGGGAAIVELRCETDFVAKSGDFVNLVGDLAQLVAAKGEGAAQERGEEIDGLGTTLDALVRSARADEDLSGSLGEPTRPEAEPKTPRAKRANGTPEYRRAFQRYARLL